MRALEKMGVPFLIVVEAQEYEAYCGVIARKRVLVLDPAYQRDYDTFSQMGADTGSKGPGPARNFAWDHAVASGSEWHWVLDDNIRLFYRLNRNAKIPAGDGTIFRCMEDFADRYSNVGMVGPNYAFFAKRKQPLRPFILNTRIYSCNLIRNDLPYRWRGRFNEDTDLSLRMLKDGWCTVQFNAFLQHKQKTQSMKGGNTDEFYTKIGTLAKSRMLCDMHPDVSTLVWKFRRWHHHVDYRLFRFNKLKLRDGVTRVGVNEYGMRIKKSPGIAAGA